MADRARARARAGAGIHGQGAGWPAAAQARQHRLHGQTAPAGARRTDGNWTAATDRHGQPGLAAAKVSGNNAVCRLSSARKSPRRTQHGSASMRACGPPCRGREAVGRTTRRSPQWPGRRGPGRPGGEPGQQGGAPGTWERTIPARQLVVEARSVLGGSTHGRRRQPVDGNRDLSRCDFRAHTERSVALGPPWADRAWSYQGTPVVQWPDTAPHQGFQPSSALLSAA
jgi:hypothetical protein